MQVGLPPKSGAMAKRRCFVISPIGDEGSGVREHADDVFRFIIEPAVKQFDIEAVRSDHIHEAGEITEQMFREILQADLRIAVLTYLNSVKSGSSPRCKSKRVGKDKR